jgi:CheY-like chemotaxis protein
VRPRVLVVDDDRSVRVIVCDMLTSLGYETDDAEGGVGGLALLERLQYDLVITDLRMPNMSGWDVVKAVRGRLLTMPIIMISGFATDDDLRHAQAVRVPLLQKPFSMSEFQRVVHEVLTSEVPARTPDRVECAKKAAHEGLRGTAKDQS